MGHVLSQRRLVVIGTGMAVLAILAVVVFSVRYLSSSDDDSRPQVTLTTAGDAVLRDSRNASPDIFGSPLQALATLDEYDAKIAIMASGGDMETAAASALYWSMTPEDVRQRTSEFIGVIGQAERLFETIKADPSLDESRLRPQLKRLVAWLGVCIYIVVTESLEYDSVMPQIAALGRDVIYSDTSSKNMLEQAAHLLYELDLRAGLDPDGQDALYTAIERNPNLSTYLPSWRGIVIRDYLSKP